MPTVKNPKVLVIDDEQGWRDLISFELPVKGYDVTTAKSGASAMGIASGSKIPKSARLRMNIATVGIKRIVSACGSTQENRAQELKYQEPFLHRLNSITTSSRALGHADQRGHDHRPVDVDRQRHETAQ